MIDSTTIHNINILFVDDNKLLQGIQISRQQINSLYLSIVSSQDCNDILAITGYLSVKFNGESMDSPAEKVIIKIDPSKIESIPFQISTMGETLLQKITNHINNMNEQDLIVIADRYPSQGITPNGVPEINTFNDYLPNSLGQRVIDIFIISLAAYLVSIELLINNNEFNELLPFRVSLPFTSDNILTQNVFRYLLSPCQAYINLLNNDSSIIRTIIQNIVEFINVWGHLFEEGTYLDRNGSLIEILDGYYSQIVFFINKIERSKEESVHLIQSIKDETINSVQKEVNLHKSIVTTRNTFDQRLSELESRVSDIVDSWTRNCDPFGIYDMSVRLSNIEGSIQEIKQHLKKI
jgi:hypothetical protein